MSSLIHKPSFGEIREVWASNLESECFLLSELIQTHPYVAVDTEFPGFLVRSEVTFPFPEQQHYYVQSLNVNFLQIIQIGITLGDRSGRPSTPCSTWQFNFKFSLTENLHSSDSIALLRQSGIDFDKFEKDGIEVTDFAHLFLSSGLVMNDEVIWIAYHGGYDFAYLLKILSGMPNPSTAEEFFKSLKIYFPHFYDIKFIVSQAEPRVSGGLSELADALSVPRKGTAHQAGSDSLVTFLSFFKYVNRTFGGVYREEKYENKLYGL
jgi:CCR4-NOT transcription complex subunit 7/8